MSVTFVYHFLLSPFKTIQTSPVHQPLKESFAVLFLVAMGSNLGFNISFGQHPFFLILLTFLGYIIWFSVQSMIIDFMAQLLSLKAQSVTLFSWLGLSCLPFLLNVPLAIFYHHSFVPGMVFYGGTFLIFFWVAALQISVLKRLYLLNTFKSVLLFMSPLMVVTVSGVLIIITLMSLFSIQDFL